MSSDDNRSSEVARSAMNKRDAIGASESAASASEAMPLAPPHDALRHEKEAIEDVAKAEQQLAGQVAKEDASAMRNAKSGLARWDIWWPVWASGALVAATAFWLLAGRWGLGRDDWFITPRRVWWSWSVWLLPFAVLALFGGLAAVSAYDRFRRAKSRGEQKTSVRLCVFALMLFALCWPWAALGPTPGGASGASNLIAVTWSEVANGYFSEAYRIEDARRFTRDYVAKQQTNYAQTQAHVATHPPGATLFYFAARRAFESSPFLQTIFTSVHRNMTGVSVSDSAAFARNVVAVGTGLRPRLPDSAAPCALWCAFLLSFFTALTVPAAYLLGAANHRKNGEDSSAKNEEGRNTSKNAKTRSATSQDTVLSAGRLANDSDRAEARGLMAAALFALAPSVGLFAFTLDALIGCLAAWTLVFMARRLGGGAAQQMVAAGVLVAFNSFFSFGALATGAVIVLAVFLWFAMRLRGQATSDRKSVNAESFDEKTADESARLNDPRVNGAEASRFARRLILDLALCALGFFAAWLLLCALLPMQPLAIFARAMQAHHQATGSRSRWGWAGVNWGMFALFSGWPVAVACLAVAMRGWKPSKMGFATTIVVSRDEGETSRVMGAAMLLTLVLLTLSGNVRGEVERLWMFALAPLCALAAGIIAPRFAPASETKVESNAPETWRARQEYAIPIALLCLQTAQNVLMTGALAPLVRPY